MYTPDQVEAAAKLLRFDDPSSGDRTYAADILDAYAATLKAAPGGVSEAMVERALAKYAMLKDQAVWPDAYSGDECEMERRDMRAALEAALSAEPAAQGDGLCQRNPAPNAAPAIGMTSTQHIVYLSPEGTAPPAQPAELTTDAQKIQWRIAYLEHGQWSKLPDGLYRVKHESPGTTVLTRAEEPAERAPEGWVLVPREPTVKMLRAGTNAEINAGPNRTALLTYLAMLAASPAPSERGKGAEG